MAAKNKTEMTETVETAETVNETAAKAEKPVEMWIVTVDNNPQFCGKGAGGAQFANGKAEVYSERLAQWFREHPGYTVTAAR